MDCLPRPYLMVAFLAPMGCLCRIALSKLEVALIGGDHSSTLSALGSGYFFANIAGCIVMSLVLKYRGPIMKFDTAFYVGLSTGFCGCLTTFSTWSQRASLLFVHGHIADGFLVLLLMHTCAWVSLNFAGTFIWPNLNSKKKDFQPANQPKRKTFDFNLRKVSGDKAMQGGRARALTLPDQWHKESDNGAPPAYINNKTNNNTTTIESLAGDSDTVPATVDDVLTSLSKRRQIPARSMSSGRTRSESKVDTRIRKNSVQTSLFAGDLASSIKSNRNPAMVEMTSSPPSTSSPTQTSRLKRRTQSQSQTSSQQSIKTQYETESSSSVGQRHNTRERALSGATYEKKSSHRRENTLGLEFMSEEDHLRFVMKRVQMLDTGGVGDDSIESYATDETILNTIRAQVLQLADAYAGYMDDFEVMEAGGDMPQYEHEDSRCLTFMLGPMLPFIVGIVALTYFIIGIVFITLGDDDNDDDDDVNGFDEASNILLSLAFAPFGALIRYRLGLLNKKYKTFPVFTLTANVCGCLVTVSMYAILLSYQSKNRLATIICGSIVTGFSGSLSTVSTLMAEARALPEPRLLVRYLGATHMLAQTVLFVINLPLALRFGSV